MTDRKLLLLAAKAAGYTPFLWDHRSKVYAVRNESGREFEWNPLADDGDAFRLAVKLQLFGLNRNRFADCFANDYVNGTQPDDPYVATRRAVVLAAADIGQAMK